MIICADDYGISPAVSQGIIELIEEGRVSATSCMMLGPNTEEAMMKLRQLKKRADLGLHLTLTDDTPLTALKIATGLVDSQNKLLPFSRLMKNAYKKNIDPQALYQEIVKQIERFEMLLGRPPDFIDGHQHVQQLPIISEAVVKAIKRISIQDQNPYMRVAGLPGKWLWTKGVAFSRSMFFGNLVIGAPAYSTLKLVNHANIFHNRYLLGYYDYEGGEIFENVFLKYLTLKPEARDIFFCHPGYVDKALRQ